MFYKNQIEWLMNAEAIAHSVSELQAVLGSCKSLSEEDTDRIQTNINHLNRKRGKLEDKLHEAFSKT